MKINKISDKVSLNVQAQSCGNDCKVKVWAGKKSSETKGCWYNYTYTAKGWGGW